MKVCTQNGLHPVFFESGLEGLFTPELLPRLGYCEYACTLCGEVCPTGAIKKLAVKEKKQVSIGLGQFVKDRCLPYAQGINCLVCEEHCPTPAKAIKFRDVEAFVPRTGETITIKEPYVIAERCVGCGICEHVCPLEGLPGIRVYPYAQQKQLSVLEQPSQSPSLGY